MSKRSREIWEYLKDHSKEIGAELHRLGVQGSMETASALFNGHAFVPYGPGQWKDAEREGSQHGEQSQQEPEQERQRGGMEI